MTDGQTDGRTDTVATICSPFGEHNIYIIIRQNIIYNIKKKMWPWDSLKTNERLLMYNLWSFKEKDLQCL